MERYRPTGHEQFYCVLWNVAVCSGRGSLPPSWHGADYCIEVINLRSAFLIDMYYASCLLLLAPPAARVLPLFSSLCSLRWPMIVYTAYSWKARLWRIEMASAIAVQSCRVVVGSKFWFSSTGLLISATFCDISTWSCRLELSKCLQSSLNDETATRTQLSANHHTRELLINTRWTRTFQAQHRKQFSLGHVSTGRS